MKRSTITSFAVASLGATAALMVSFPAQANQPNMKAALASLNEAKQHLKQATTGKGGHRVKAIELIDEAIEEVRKGIQAGRM